MKIECETCRPLPAIADPDDVKYLVQIYILHVMLDCWKIFREANKEITIVSAREARHAERRNAEIHWQVLLAEYIALAAKQGALLHKKH